MLRKRSTVRSRLLLSLAAAALALASLNALAASTASPSALLSQVRGEVTLASPSGTSQPQALPLQQVADGATLRLARGAEVVILCADDRVLRLTGPAAWSPGPGSCASGQALPAGTYQRLVPARGQVRSFNGNLLEESASRSDDEEGKVPVLLNPRSPQRGQCLILESAPTITWSAVAGALEYELELQRGRQRQTERLAAARVKCLEDRLSSPLRACSLDWPWAPLEPGEEVELLARAFTADPDRPTREGDRSRLRRTSTSFSDPVNTELGALDNLSLPPATRELLRAAVLSEAGLPNEAAAALAASLDAQPQAAAAARLGDLYLGLGLLRGAQNLYSLAERWLPPRGGENEVRAAVALGLGRLYLRRKDPQPLLAVQHLQRAERLYRQLGWSTEADAAALEKERAQRGSR